MAAGLRDPARRREAVVGVASSLAVIVVALSVGTAIITIAGYSPGDTFSAMWHGAFVGEQSIDGTLETMVPLVLAGLAWIVALRARRINVGVEGQILIGGVTATLVGLHVHLPAAMHLPLIVLAAAAGGALWAGVAAALWAWRGVNEIISTFMLNLIASLFVLYLVTGPLQEPTGQQAISSTIDRSARWPAFFGHSGLGWDIVLIPVGVGLVAWTLRHTTTGFRLQITGANPEAARHVGVSVAKLGGLAIVASGAIAGLAASSLLSSQGGALQHGFSSNLGFEGIAVALLARNSPIGCIPAALLLAALEQGGGLAEAQVGLDTSLIDVTFGVVVILASASLYVEQHRWTSPGRWRGLVRRRRPAAT